MTTITDTNDSSGASNAVDSSTDTPNAVDPVAFAEMQTQLQTLLAHNKTIQAENKTLRTEKSKAAQDVAAKSGDLESLTALHMQELASRDQLIATYEKKEADRKIGDAIQKAFNDFNVMSEMRDPLSHFLANGASVVEDRVMKDGMDITLALKTFFSSPTSKAYIAAPVNSGGGSTGSTANSGQWSSPPTLEKTGEWSRWAANNREAATAIAKGWGPGNEHLIP